MFWCSVAIMLMFIFAPTQVEAVKRLAFIPAALTPTGDINYDFYHLRSPNQGLVKRNVTRLFVGADTTAYECSKIVTLSPLRVIFVDNFGIEISIGFQTTVRMTLQPSAGNKLRQNSISEFTKSQSTTRNSQRVTFSGLTFIAPRAGVYRFVFVAFRSNSTKRHSSGFIDIAIVASKVPTSLQFVRFPSKYLNIFTHLTQQPIVRLIDEGNNTVKALDGRSLSVLPRLPSMALVPGAKVLNGNVTIIKGIAIFTQLNVVVTTPLTNMFLSFELGQMGWKGTPPPYLQLLSPVTASFCNTTHVSLAAYMYPDRAVAQTRVRVYIRGGVFPTQLQNMTVCRFNARVFPAAFIDECNVECVLQPEWTTVLSRVEVSADSGITFATAGTFYPIYPADALMTAVFDDPVTNKFRIVEIDPQGIRSPISDITLRVADMWGTSKQNYSASNYSVAVRVVPEGASQFRGLDQVNWAINGVASFKNLFIVGHPLNTNYTFVFTATSISNGNVISGFLRFALAWEKTRKCTPPPVITSFSSSGCLGRNGTTLTQCRSGERIAVTITGRFFGLSGARVQLNSATCAVTHDVINVSTLLMCFCVLTETTNFTIITIANLQVSTVATAFVINSPVTVTSVTGCPLDFFPSTAECSSDKSTTVTILGANFGSNQAKVIFQHLNSNLTVPCLAVVHSPLTPTTKLTCQLPPIVGSALVVTVRNNMTLQLGVPTNGAAINFEREYGILCPTDHEGYFCSNRGVCSLEYGTCACTSGPREGYWMGAVCEQCKPEYFSGNCSLPCPKCSARNSVCDDGVHGTGTCVCNFGWAGPLCTIPCPGGANTPCNLKGSCVTANVSCQCFSSLDTGYWQGAACGDCEPGWSGPNCTTPCPVADGSVCSNRGKCANGACRCNRGFCDVACNSSSCSGCDTGRFGALCENICPGGLDNICFHHGFCNDGPVGSGLCSCNSGYGGPNCTITCPRGPDNACSGHGSCAVEIGVCTCNPGYTLLDCSQPCPGGALSPCYGQGVCDVADGSCTCDYGYSGDACNYTCPGGATSPCSLHGVCSQKYANCTCFADEINGFWQGATCNQCLDFDGGYWTPQCNKRCPASHGNHQCGGHGVCSDKLECTCQNSPESGHWTGSACEECIAGYWGSECLKECEGSACNPCTKHGNCSQGVNGTGQCSCDRNNRTGFWTASVCDRCESGWFGLNCTNRCPTNGTNGTDGVVCSGRGVCSDGIGGLGVCACFGTYGLDNCAACAGGFFGKGCLERCPGPPGRPCNGVGICISTELSNGTCACEYGYAGAACTVLCPLGPYGLCNGKGVCALSGEALICVNCSSSLATGYYQGVSCSECQPGYYGSACRGICPGGAATSCSKNGICSDGLLGSGSCSCNIGYAGLSCEIVCDGGVLQPCSGHGTCDAITGTCSCYSTNDNGFWVGSACSECDALHSGSSCTQLCPAVVEVRSTLVPCSGHGTCFQGNCIVCQTGFCGPFCNLTVRCAACPRGTYGDNCAPCPGGQATPCLREGICIEGRYGTGQCMCNASFRGSMCEKRCPGPDGIPCYGRGSCDLDGACTCKGNNWAGAACNITCDGYDETKSTPPCNRRGQCNPIDGRCQCEFGFGGYACRTVCPGLNLTTLEVCSRHGQCRDGVCECYKSNLTGFWNGSSCSYCLDRHFGDDCIGVCLHGVSDATHTLCVCDPFWSGEACNIPCPGIENGNLSNACYGHGVCTYGMLENSVCTCDTDYYNFDCNVPCTKQQCDKALTNGQCNVITGDCECQFNADGHWAYTDKNQTSCTTCNIFYYGPSCERPCSCSFHGSCDRRTGICECYGDLVRGYWGGATCAACLGGYIGVQCQALNIEVTPLDAFVAFCPVATLDVITGIICQDPLYPFLYFGTRPISITSTATDSAATTTTTYVDLGGYALACFYPTPREIFIYTFGEAVNYVNVFDRQTGTFLRSETIRRAATGGRRLDALADSNSTFSGATMKRSGMLPPIQGGTGETTITAYASSQIVFFQLSTGVQSTSFSSLTSIFDIQPATKDSSMMVISGLIGERWEILLASSTPPTNLQVVASSTFSNMYNASLNASCRDCAPVKVFSDGFAVVSIVHSIGSSEFSAGLNLARMTANGDAILIRLFSLVVCNITATILDRFSGYGYFAMNCGSQPSILQKFDFATCFVVGTLPFSIVGADVEIAVAVSILEDRRVLQILTPLSGVHRVHLVSLYAVIGIKPLIADTTGGTRITVKGQGFIPGMYCVFNDEKKKTPKYAVATVNSQFEMVCEAPSGGTASCVGETVEAFLPVSGSTVNEQHLQRVASANIREVWDHVTNSTVGLLAGGNVSVFGSGFLITDDATLLKCKLYAGTVPSQVIITRATFVSSSHVICPIPPMTIPTVKPSFLEVSVDGTVFSSSRVEYATLGFAASIFVDQPSNEFQVKADKIGKVPTVIVKVADSMQHPITDFLSTLDPSKYHVVTVSSPDVQLNGTLSISMADGIAVFPSIQIILPRASANISLVFTETLKLWTAVVRFSVVEGDPFAMVFIRLPSTSVTPAQSTLSNQPVVGIVDVSNNILKDLSNKQPRVKRINLTYFFLTAKDAVVNRLVEVEELNAQFRIDGVFITGKHEEPYYLTFQCADLPTPTLVSPPIVVGWCLPTEFAVQNSSACVECPANGLCDGTYNIKTRDGYWRADNTTLSFYSCGAPFSGDSCFNDSTCADGYKGPRCSVCVEGYGRSGRHCQKCKESNFNNFLVFCACFALAFVAALCVYSLITSPARDILPVIVRCLVAYFQMLGRLNNLLIPWPPILESLWQYLESTANLQAFDFSPFSCALRTDYLHMYAISMAIPWVVIFMVSPLAILIVRFLAQKHDHVQLATQIAEVCRAEEQSELLVRLEVANRRRKQSLAINPLTALHRSSTVKEVESVLVEEQPPDDDSSGDDVDEGTIAKHLEYNKAGNRVDFVKSISDVRETRFTPMSVIFVTSVTVLTLLYPTMVTNSGQVLRCEAMDLGARGIHPVSVHQRTVLCDSDYYMTFRNVALGMIMGYGVSTPLALVGVTLFLRYIGGVVKARAILAFFMAGFRRELWFWESVNMMRKFLAMLVVVFVENDNLQMIVFMWVSVLGFILHITFAPYVSQTVHILESLAHVALIITTNLVLMFFFLERERMATDWRWLAISIGIIFLNGIAIMAFAAVLGKQLQLRVVYWIGRGERLTQEAVQMEEMINLMKAHAKEVALLRAKREQLRAEMKNYKHEHGEFNDDEEDDNNLIGNDNLVQWSFPVEESSQRRQSKVQFTDYDQIVELPAAEASANPKWEAQLEDDYFEHQGLVAIQGMHNDYWVKPPPVQSASFNDVVIFTSVKDAVNDAFGFEDYSDDDDGKEKAAVVAPLASKALSSSVRFTTVVSHQLTADTLRKFAQKDATDSLRVIGENDDDENAFLPLIHAAVDDDVNFAPFEQTDRIAQVGEWRSKIELASSIPTSFLPADYGYRHDEVAEVEFLEGRLDTPPSPPIGHVAPPAAASITDDIREEDEDAVLDFDARFIPSVRREESHGTLAPMGRHILTKLDKVKAAPDLPPHVKTSTSTVQNPPLIPAFFMFSDQDDEASPAPQKLLPSKLPPGHENFNIDLSKCMDDTESEGSDELHARSQFQRDAYKRPGSFLGGVTQHSASNNVLRTSSFLNGATMSSAGFLLRADQPMLPGSFLNVPQPVGGGGGLSPNASSLSPQHRRTSKRMSYKNAPEGGGEEAQKVSTPKSGGFSPDTPSSQLTVPVDITDISVRRSRSVVSFNEMSGVFDLTAADASTSQLFKTPSRPVYMTEGSLMEALGGAGFFDELMQPGSRRLPEPSHDPFNLPPGVVAMSPQSGLAMAHGTIPIATRLPRAFSAASEFHDVEMIPGLRVDPNKGAASTDAHFKSSTASKSKPHEPDLFAGLDFLLDDDDDALHGHRQELTAVTAFVAALPTVQTSPRAPARTPRTRNPENVADYFGSDDDDHEDNVVPVFIPGFVDQEEHFHQSLKLSKQLKAAPQASAAKSQKHGFHAARFESNAPKPFSPKSMKSAFSDDGAMTGMNSLAAAQIGAQDDYDDDEDWDKPAAADAADKMPAYERSKTKKAAEKTCHTWDDDVEGGAQDPPQVEPAQNLFFLFDAASDDEEEPRPAQRAPPAVAERAAAGQAKKPRFTRRLGSVVTFGESETHTASVGGRQPPAHAPSQHNVQSLGIEDDFDDV